MSQDEAAASLGIRQATLSHVERGRSNPNCALLRQLAGFFDVTPTFLLDDERGVRPRPSERWRFRDVLVTVGMWTEVDRHAVEDIGGDKVLCPLLPGERFYDDEAAAVRRRVAAAVPSGSDGRGESPERTLEQHLEALEVEERELIARLEADLTTHPRRRQRHS